MLSSLVRFRSNSFVRRHRFWLLNGLLLLLYLWTLTGQTGVAVTVNNGMCTAAVPGRTIQVACPELRTDSRVGLYLRNPEPEPQDVFVRAPLDWLAPRAAWASAALFDASGNAQWADSFTRRALVGWEQLTGVWQTVAGELRTTSERAAILRRTPVSHDFTFTAELRRPEGEGGLLLLEPDGKKGLAFIVSGASRRGTWWRWAEGEPVASIIGLPVAKSPLTQFKWLLRVALRAHQGALLLLGASWVIALVGRRLNNLAPHFVKVWPAANATTVIPLFRLYLTSLFVSAGQIPYALRGSAIQTEHIRKAQRHHDQPWKPMAVWWVRPAIGVIILLGFAATLFIASDVLERIPHVQDSVTYLFQAQTLAGGRLAAPAPSLPDFSSSNLCWCKTVVGSVSIPQFSRRSRYWRLAQTALAYQPAACRAHHSLALFIRGGAI